MPDSESIRLSQPLVSVIIPCYNQGRYLPEAVASLQAQTYSHWECLIINDGSTDNTAEIGVALAATDGRVRFSNQIHCGQGAVRNSGLDMATGQYVQFLDADDKLLPHKLERQIGVLKGARRLALAYCDYQRGGVEDIDTKPSPPAPYLPPRYGDAPLLFQLTRDWETRMSIPCHCFLFDARLFSQHGIRFDSTLPNHLDWDCWMRMAVLPLEVFFCDEVLAIYRYHSESLCHNVKMMQVGFLYAIDKQIRIHCGNPGMLKILKDKRQETIRCYANKVAYGRTITRAKRLVARVAKKGLPDWIQKRIRSALGRNEG
jgi:glycosyltransferase involved in cell wall biosynthesis